MLIVTAAMGAFVLIALVVTVGNANHERDHALQLQRHSYDVMILARTLSGTIAQSEASLGRYVISGDEALGSVYFDQWKLAGDQINRLDQITDDNPSLQRPIDALRIAYRTRGDELVDVALSTRYKKNDQALARYYAARQSPSLARINDLLELIIGRERALLERRTGDAMASVTWSSNAAKVLMVFGGLIVLGAIVLGWLTVQALAERASARAEAEVERERSADLEEAVARATAELRAQEGRLRQIQKMEAVGQLTGGIAHDFNNMLAVVIGGLELAARQLKAGGPDAARHIDSAMEGANRAAALTRRLLAFSREEALRAEPIEAGALVAGMSDLLDRTIGDAITVTVSDDGCGWATRADKLQLENVLLNLAVNARDAMNGRGRLAIATAGRSLAAGAIGSCAAGDYVTIAVTDSGCGMTPETIERVFEPFFTTKPTGQGTGLGLSQAFAFVRQAEGEIVIESTPGSGTTVTLFLPRHQNAASDVGNAPIAAETQATPAALRVLVVEDDPRVLGATMGALRELGHEAIACDDPLAAPRLLEQHGAIDVIVSDVLMPGQTGPEMIAALTPRWPRIAVLFVTGFAGDASEAAFGGHAVLRKPFTIAALDRALGEAVAASRAAPDRVAAA
ncbi:ATP-binding protein [Sphingomonas sp. AR_OL41]|uniref:ATP-binding protein n=1 Tax=Sphingomonas sp. AR_OL41 TaxID=3042729 RepID=UPI002480AF76|nr:ATP-binding protein [Sphingomonas sp. AR_OL41]MDH7971349.1 ATP-binding protein [Sphingomonas sp. AR_OL41]